MNMQGQTSNIRGVFVKEIISMWKYNTMVALTVLCAGIYMLFLLPFKAIPIIPGITEIRPATLFPVLFGLLFGPAGAWGSAIGNLAGDLFGTFSIGSIFGFIGNFFFAYIPYKLWGKLEFISTYDRTPTINSARKLVEFGIVSLTASISCAVIIAWGLDVLKLVAFASLSVIITLNNTVITLLLGPIVLPAAYRFVKKSGLLWTDIMHVRDISKPNPDRINTFMVFTGSAGGLVFGLAICLLFTGQTFLGQSMATYGSGSLIAGIGILPFLVVLFYGSINL